jgi:glycine C-acetyltransferase
VFVDEAHSVLVCGRNGRGVCEAEDVETQVGLYYGTFSKAFGGVGGFVSGRADTIEYLRAYAHPYGFSCALPPATVAGLLAALEVASRDDTARRRLLENADYFRAKLRALGFDIGNSTTHVVPIIVGGEALAFHRLGHELRARGLFVAPINYPAVPQDRVRFRASISAQHTRADLDEALAILGEVLLPARAA